MQSVRVGWIYDRRFLQHDTGEDHPESPARLVAIVNAVEQAGLLSQLVALPFRQASSAELTLAHDPAYVDLVRMMCDAGFSFVGSRETRICRQSYDIAALAAGGVLAACEAVMAGHITRAFCAVRPPGHHAEFDAAMGYCLFNHVAIAAEHLVRNHGLTRVAIVDFDVHHGNGTQHFFAERSDVLYISLHERPGSIGFPGTGEADEIGSGAGAGYTLNVPLNRGSGPREYLAALAQHVEPALTAFRPEFLLLSAGFDALMWDNSSNLNLQPGTYGALTDSLVQIAARHAQGRVVSVLEGGYHIPQLGAAVVAHILAMSEEE
jgi:acetoin utilization deacetylase AcuC-like enzyme